MILHVLIAILAGWLQRHQQQVITYLIEENRVLKAHLGGRQLRLSNDDERQVQTRETLLQLAMIRLMGRQLARSPV
jgi:putative transposase